MAAKATVKIKKRVFSENVVTQRVPQEEFDSLKELAFVQKPEIARNYDKYDSIPEWLFYRTLINAKSVSDMLTSHYTYRENVKNIAERQVISSTMVQLFSDLIEAELRKPFPNCGAMKWYVGNIPYPFGKKIGRLKLRDIVRCFYYYFYTRTFTERVVLFNDILDKKLILGRGGDTILEGDKLEAVKDMYKFYYKNHDYFRSVIKKGRN